MRLINTETLELEEFFDAGIPKYAMLSHTWGAQEVTFQDMKTRARKHKKGLQKILKCCERAQAEGIEYAWVDTCCIDKTSISELSEAINSMYRWYQASEICYAYLEDYEPIGNIPVPNLRLHRYQEHLVQKFRLSRLFSRGWTLQELIAPKELHFYDRTWTWTGTRSSMAEARADVTDIDRQVLSGEYAAPKSYSVAARMSWAARRNTTRVEDVAYCLMGVFDVNMPLLYGEGSRAFIRLQEEIMKQVDDYTLFAWRARRSLTYHDYCARVGVAPERKHQACASLLAFHPSAFIDSRL